MKHKFLTIASLVMGLNSLGVSSFASEDDPVLMTIGNNYIKKSEFEYIYNKNRNLTANSERSLDDYVEMFVNYKLKVEEAYKLNYQLRPKYMDEYDKYENQIMVPYMRDEESENALLQEAFERSKVSTLASHILIKVESGADTTEARNKINNIYRQLKNGKDFAELAKQYSECPTGETGGSLGYVEVFSTVYDFENAMFATPVGSFSAPFRTEFGYHIVKVYERRPNYKERRISHILVTNDRKNFSQRADSIFQLAKDGKNFAELARQYSDDKASGARGGDLGIFQKGLYPMDFDRAVANLKNEGDVIKTGSAFGVHIIKLTQGVPYKSLDDNRKALMEKLQRSSRMIISTVSYENKLKDKYGVTIIPEGLEVFQKLTKEPNLELRETKYYRNMDDPLYTFKGNTYPQREFVKYFRARFNEYEQANKGNMVNRSKSAKINMDNFVEKTFDSYILRMMVAEEREELISTNSDVRNLLREYSDGLLLFEISSDKVWNRANSNPEGLKNYFENHRENYKWDSPRFKGIVVQSTNKEDYDKVENLLKTNSLENCEQAVRDAFKDRLRDVRIKTGAFVKGVNSAVDEKYYKSGEYKNSTFPFVSVRGSLIDKPQEYIDVRGAVTADFQNYIDSEWVKKLREEYPVRIFKDVLKTIK